MANKKMTYSTALEQAIAMLTSTDGVNSEVIEKLTALKATLDKKNASPKKQTAQQKKNADGMNELLVTISRKIASDVAGGYNGWDSAFAMQQQRIGGRRI